MRKLFLLALAAIPFTAFAQQAIDEGYTKKIKEYTTEPFFLTELVDHLPAHPTVPTPEKVLGRIVGTPNVLTYVEDINRYMRALDEASPRVMVQSMGLSEEGREMLLVIISDEENLARLDHYKQINAKLADPRATTDAEAKELMKEALPMYYATGGMHSPESGPPEMLMELAYRLAVEETPFIQAIRKNSITLLTPVLDTDGRDRYVDTYMYRKQNPGKPAIPLVYWGKYVAHDNNRDGMALSLALSKNIMKMWFDFHPIVMHDLHESVPFLYISTGTGPYNAWLDPITIDEWHITAYHEVNELTKRGVPGVWTHDFFDGWAPNYGFYAANGHNALGRFYETYGGNGADTGIRTVGGQSQRDWFRPNPPFPRVRWSIRNNTNLMQSGVLFGLHHVATEKEKFLENFYLKSKRAVAKARTEGPAAWVLPSDDRRKGQQTALLELLDRQGVEIHTLNADLDTAEGKFPRGSYVVRMDQPYSRMADMVLDTQYYSPSDPRPYDDTGWTLGPLFNVKTVRVKDVKILEAAMTRAQPGIVPARLGNWPQANTVVVPHPGDFAVAQLRYRHPNLRIEVAEEGFKAGLVDKKDYPSGTLVLRAANPREAADLASLVAGYGLQPFASSDVQVKTHELKVTRIALVHTWTSTQDEGWFRLAFDNAGIPYSYVSVHELRDTLDLRAKYDVIVLPQARGSAQSIVNGREAAEPIPWKPLPGFRHLGGPDTTDDIRGGIELQGMLNVQRFLKAGGLLVCVGNMCAVPIDYGLVEGVSITEPQELVAPGGVYLTENQAKQSPVLYGYDDTLGAYFSANSSPLLSLGGGGGGGRGAAGGGRASGRGSVTDPDVIQGRAAYNPTRREGDEPDTPQAPGAPRPQVLLRFASADKVLISGALQNGQELAGKAAAVLCPVGNGNVLLFALNPMWRQQTHGSWQLIFNAAMSYDHLRTVRPSSEPLEESLQQNADGRKR